MSDEQKDIGPWTEWRRLIFAELERHGADIKYLQREQNKQSVKLQVLWAKVGMITAGIATLVSAIVAVIIKLVS